MELCPVEVGSSSTKYEALVKMDWVPCENWGVPVNVSPAGVIPTDIILATPIQVSEAPAVTAPDEHDDITVLRTVGVFNMFVTDLAGDIIPAEDLRWDMRIRTAVLDATGVPLTYTDVLGVGGAVDANEPFMWERHNRELGRAVNLGNELLNAARHPYHFTIDCRVKRRLTLQECTCLSVIAFTLAPGTQDIKIQLFVRTLVALHR